MKRILNLASKMIIYMVILNFFAVIASAQSTFQKTYSLQVSGFNLDNIVRDVIIDSQENFVYTGYVKEFVSQGSEGFLFKTDKDGNVLWYKGFYDSIQNNSTTISSLIEVSDGGYLLSGSNPSISLGVGGTIVKVDSSGGIEWIKKDLPGEELGISKLIRGVNGDIIGVGTVNNNSIGRFLDATIVRFDSNGNFLWGKCIGTTGTEYGNHITPTSDNGCVFIGTTNPSNQASGSDIYFGKLDSLGNLLWSKKIGGNDAEGSVYYTRIIELSDGSLLLAAPTKSFGFGDNDIIVVKSDILGNTIWTKVYGTSNSEIPYAVEELSNGDILIIGGVGFTNPNSSAALAIKLDSSGNILWSIRNNYLVS
jgi:hypothetical protein